MGGDAYELKRTDSICPSPEAELFEAVRTNEVHKIRSVVRENPSILSTIYGHPYNKPMLYIACFELADEVLPSTVQALIRLGADLHYADEADDYMEVLHFATQSQNSGILRAIIENLKPGEINATSNGNTAINLLVKKGKLDSGEFEKCLKLLLSGGINVNKADLKNATPILWAAHKGYKKVVEIILNNSNFVDIDTHKMKQKSARILIEEKGLYSGRLPDQSSNNNEGVKEILFGYVKDGREDEFVNFPGIEDHVDVEEAEGTLLQLACKSNRKRIVEHLIENHATIAKRTEKNRDYPIQIAAKMGYHRIFGKLLEHTTKIPDDILTILLKNIDAPRTAEIDHQECLNALLDKENICLNVNAKHANGNTPLHYSTRYADPEITLNLLERGASLGNKNKFGYLPVEDIDAQTLKEHFDNCVTAEPKTKFDKQSTVLTFDYNSLLPTKTESKILVPSKVASNDEAQTFHLTIENNLKDIEEMVAETDVVYSMSKIPELRNLLKHPLITSFLFIKWHRMRWFFYTNLIFYTVFCLSLVLYIFLNYSSNILRDYPSISVILSALSIITFAVLLLRELFQILVSPKAYFFHVENWIEMTLIVVTSLILFQGSPEPETVRQLSSVAILLAALEMMLLIGQHPKMSTNIVMLRTVSYNFFKFLLWYAILILAFALSFYKLFNKENEKQEPQNSAKRDEDDEQDFFVDPSLAIIKTIVMLTGEFDASSINFHPLPNRIIFLLFVFMIAIILFNLLNGLAVSDTQMIKNDAEIVGHVERINHIVYIENMMLGNMLPSNLFVVLQKLCCCLAPEKLRNYAVPKPLAKLVCLFLDFLPENRLEVFLNQEGKIIRENDPNRWFNQYGVLYLDKKAIKRVKLLLQERKSNERMAKQSDLLKEREERIRTLEKIVESQQETIKQLSRCS